MGLKFQRDDSLEKMLEGFVILPDAKDKKPAADNADIERFLNPKPKKQANKKTEQKK